MRILLLLLPLTLLVLPSQEQEDSKVVVVSHKWTKTRQILERTENANTGPAAAMIPQNKNFQRNVRANEPMGVRDPNQDTLDGRSAAMEKSVQDSRKPPSKPVDAFAYKVKVQNNAAQAIDILFWEYQFTDRANPKNPTRHQFLCAASIKPGKDKEIQAFSLSGPSDVINVKSLEKNPDNPFDEKVLINRVEFVDGSIWQRKDWDFSEIGISYRRAIATPWTKEMCRSL